MLTDKLKSLIKDYPDFPKKGIIFKDISPILMDPDAFSELIEKMSSRDVYQRTDAIVAIDARGFIFGSAISNKLKKPLVLARKSNKLPGKLIEKDYGLEYGKDTLSLQESAISRYRNFVIIDDLLATGGTAKCVSDILTSKGKSILALNVVIELLQLSGSSNLGFPVFAEIKIS